MLIPYTTGEAGGSGTWYLAIKWQNQHFLRGLRVFNFVPVPSPESRFQRETLEPVNGYKICLLTSSGLDDKKLNVFWYVI